ncbi:hypothetical protein ACFXGT_29110 [Streptomyces sp. NPDC059352]|uniref:hypothetical protein n=1 Tax=Streptomyces sp. NPDC059352 TaxID=3346810 RepID=UPI003683647D
MVLYDPDMGFVKKWLAKNGMHSIGDGARDAIKRGDTTYAYRFHPSPRMNPQEPDVTRAINEVEALGWKLHSRELEGSGLQRCWNLTFTRAAE